jgi:hypothetical protein
VEWKQITPFLGWQDYMATGQADLAVAFADRMHDLSFIAFMDNATGVLETDKMGRHIVCVGKHTVPPPLPPSPPTSPSPNPR